jgi:hypothetical protein
MRWAIFAAIVNGVLGFVFAVNALEATSPKWAALCPSVPVVLVIDHFENMSEDSLFSWIAFLNAAIYAVVVFCGVIGWKAAELPLPGRGLIDDQFLSTHLSGTTQGPVA